MTIWRERIVSLMFIGLGLFMYFYLIPTQVPPGVSAQFGLSPATFPQGSAILLTLLSLINFLDSFRLPINKEKMSERNSSVPQTDTFRLLITCTILISYVPLLIFLGYFISTIFVLSILMFNFGFRSKFRVPLIAIALTVILYLFFQRLMLVQLPVGFLFE